MHVKLLLPAAPTWNAEIDRIGALLDVQNNPYVFPYHFLQVVLPALGGAMVEVTEDDAPGSPYLLVGFLLPRGVDKSHAAPAPTPRAYTFRHHNLTDDTRNPTFVAEVAATIRDRLHASAVIPYSPADHHTYTRTDLHAGVAGIGRPDAHEAAQIRTLHREIWNSPPEYLYPTDIHCDEFGLGTSLVARVEDQVAGFLFGFYRFGGPALPADWYERFGGDLRLESQVMGVSPRFRGMRLGNLLKRTQAEEALANGVRLIHWTADPLQYPNAALNFGLLRAMAFSFTRDYYPFRNDLNRVPASRFALTWLIDTQRVRDIPLVGSSSLILDLEHQRDIVRVNDGFQETRFDVDAPYIAVEIPANWGQMQRDDLPAALRWRETTDDLFAHYIGIRAGQYAVTGAAVHGDRRFLVAQRASVQLWEQLAT